MDDRRELSALRRSVADMTHHRKARAVARRATVYGERIEELLAALAAICSSGQVLPASSSSGHDQDMLCLSLTLPTSTGGSLRRAMLRSEADALRRQADGVGTRASALPCQHCRESAAIRAVMQRLQSVALRLGITGATVAERAVLLGQIAPATPCRSPHRH